MIGKRDILEIAGKILGLFCLIQAIPCICSVTYIPVERIFLPCSIGPLVFYLVTAFILLKWSRGIAALFVREDKPIELEISRARQESLYAIIPRILGAVVCVRAVPAIIGILAIIALRSANVTTITAWVSLISNVVYLAFGIYFIVGAKAIVRFALRGSQRESDSGDR